MYRIRFEESSKSNYKRGFFSVLKINFLKRIDEPSAKSLKIILKINRFNITEQQ